MGWLLLVVLVLALVFLVHEQVPQLFVRPFDCGVRGRHKALERTPAVKHQVSPKSGAESVAA